MGETILGGPRQLSKRRNDRIAGIIVRLIGIKIRVFRVKGLGLIGIIRIIAPCMRS